jgi:hypothetical protein
MPEIADLLAVRHVPDALRSIALLEPPAWTRLEPQSITGDPAPGLNAAVHDALWLLGRQWQFGEFKGEDAGTPISVRIATRTERVTAWQPGPLGSAEAARPLPDGEPLDPWIEREAPAPRGPGLRQRAEAGATLVVMLRDAGLNARAVLVQRFPLPLDDAPGDGLPPEFAKVPPEYVTLARSCPDAEAVAAALEQGTRDFLGDDAAVTDAADEWLAWYRGSVSPRAGSVSPAWLPERLEYRFSIRTGNGRAQRVFHAPLHEGGAVDWYSFDHVKGRALQLDRDEDGAAEERTQTVLATPLRYGGMPADRLWEFEDGGVNLGMLETQPHDLARLCFTEFATIYSADWFVVPVDVNVGTCTQVTELSYLNTFGERFTVPHADDQGRTGRFRMFVNSEHGSDATIQGLLVPPSARGVLEGPPLESVLLLRDEMANMAWAVEKRVQTVTGEPRERDEPIPDNAVDGMLQGAELQYLLQTAVPRNWIPLVPVATGQGGFVLRKGTMSGQPDWLGVLLDPTPFTLREEEVPREGLLVRRVPSLARARDGHYMRWIARRVGVGRGEGSSALASDAAVR